MQYKCQLKNTHKFMHFNYYLGVDVSKETLDAAIYPCKDRKADFLHISNDTKGLNEMVKWLRSRKVKTVELLICAEHTGVYTNNLISFTDKKSIAFCLESPLAIKKSLGIARGKNDIVDAFRIAEYAYTYREKLKLYQKPSETIVQLQHLLTERRQYVKQRTSLLAIKSELGKYDIAKTKARRDAALRRLQKIIEEIESQMKSIIAEDADVKHNYDLVSSVMGIGLINAVSTIVYTKNFHSFDTPRQYACYIGVAPFDNTSGTSIKGQTRVSPLCRSQQKSELSMAARSAIMNDPWIRKYYQRKMKEKGGARNMHGIVLNAVKFKLIMRMFAVVKSGEQYKVLNY